MTFDINLLFEMKCLALCFISEPRALEGSEKRKITDRLGKRFDEGILRECISPPSCTPYAHKIKDCNTLEELSKLICTMCYV